MILKFRKKHGLVKITNSRTGKPVMEKNYLSGKLDGDFKYFWDNGNLRVSGSFKNQKRVGSWKNYDKKGAIIFEEKFD
tara:strand:- start:448 stop:681 length:234 start_codon:yes stop_codon:yes gene_type:complete